MDEPRARVMLESTPNVPALNFGKLKSGNVVLRNFGASPIIPIHSSTLNDSLVDSVEQWNLTITPAAPSPWSATTSPIAFYQNHQKSLQRTPVKAVATSKLGSPERNEIIAGRRPTVGKWVFTPKPERSSPAKKRLFGLHHVGGGGGVAHSRHSLLSAHARHDPVAYFMKRRNIRFVVAQIFGELPDRDLYNCRRVSRAWRDAVDSFPAIQKAAVGFAKKVESNKENPALLASFQSQAKAGGDSPGPPAGLIGDKFIQVGQTLKENQHLTKCRHCENPQVVEHNIGQCLSCGYICCLRCESESHRGPEHFVDKCRSSALVLPREARDARRRTLMDSPPSNSQLSFLSACSPHGSPSADNSHLYAPRAPQDRSYGCGNGGSGAASKDSCYFSYEDSAGSAAGTPDSSLSSAFAAVNGQRSNKRTVWSLSSALGSAGDERAKRPARPSSACLPVLPLRRSPERGAPEDSPVGDNRNYKGAGTAASRKRLRRLLR